MRSRKVTYETAASLWSSQVPQTKELVQSLLRNGRPVCLLWLFRALTKSSKGSSKEAPEVLAKRVCDLQDKAARAIQAQVAQIKKSVEDTELYGEQLRKNLMDAAEHGHKEVEDFDEAMAEDEPKQEKE